MKHTIDDILAYINSLPRHVSELLNEENRQKLEQFRIDSEPNDYIYEFPNGYQVYMFRPFNSGGWTVELYAQEEGRLISELRDLMQVQFTPAELDQMRALKSAFDPDWLLNPAKVFPLEGNPAFAVLPQAA